MEYTFGLLFGLALGLAAWQEREPLQSEFTAHQSQRAYQSAFRGVLFLVITAVLIAIGISIEYFGSIRFNYTVMGAALLFIALYVNALAWHIAITTTSFAFLLDLAEGFGLEWNLVPFWVALLAAAALAVVVWHLVERRRVKPTRVVPGSFWLLLWTAFGVATVKTLAQVLVLGHLPVEYGLFVAATAAVWWLAKIAGTQTRENCA